MPSGTQTEMKYELLLLMLPKLHSRWCKSLAVTAEKCNQGLMLLRNPLHRRYLQTCIQGDLPAGVGKRLDWWVTMRSKV